ncbi:hypothetical protein JMUB7547_28720 [Staphylococcus aureus]
MYKRQPYHYDVFILPDRISNIPGIPVSYTHLTLPTKLEV